MQKTLINGLTTIFNCILLWNTSIWHNDMFCPHNHLLKTTTTTSNIRELSSPRLVQSASWLVRKLSSPLVDQSARCPVRELAIRELAYPRVVHLTSEVQGAVNGPVSQHSNLQRIKHHIRDTEFQLSTMLGNDVQLWLYWKNKTTTSEYR